MDLGRSGLWSVALSVAVCGCGSSVTETGDGGAGNGDSFESHLLECGVAITCPTLGYQSYGPPNPPSLPSKEEYDCALAALRDRTPTLLVVSSGCEGSCNGDVYLIRSDGTALTQSWHAGIAGGTHELAGHEVDFGTWEDYGRECSLKAPSFYQACDTAEGGDCALPPDWFSDCKPAENKRCDGG